MWNALSGAGLAGDPADVRPVPPPPATPERASPAPRLVVDRWWTPGLDDPSADRTAPGGLLTAAALGADLLDPVLRGIADALEAAARDAGVAPDVVRRAMPRRATLLRVDRYPLAGALHELPADPGTRAGRVVLLVGEPTAVLPRCTAATDGAAGGRAWREALQLRAGGLQPIAVAARRARGVETDPWACALTLEALASGFTLLGLVAVASAAGASRSVGRAAPAGAAA